MVVKSRAWLVRVGVASMGVANVFHNPILNFQYQELVPCTTPQIKMEAQREVNKKHQVLLRVTYFIQKYKIRIVA